MTIRFLHTNDLHGMLTDAVEKRLLDLRSEVDFYFDSGDAIKTGNLGIPLRPEPVWPRFNRLNLDASVLGNRETHVLASAFEAKIAGHAQPILVSNLFRKDGTQPFGEPLIWTKGDVRIGVFGVMVPMVTERMKTKAASAYLWTSPFAEADRVVAELRPQVDLLVALTHIGHRQDVELAKRRPEIDIIFGGHSHTILPHPDLIGDVAVCQGGSHARFAGVYEWSNGRLEGELQALT